MEHSDTAILQKGRVRRQEFFPAATPIREHSVKLMRTTSHPRDTRLKEQKWHQNY
jgi:hypothetical protein